MGGTFPYLYLWVHLNLDPPLPHVNPDIEMIYISHWYLISIPVSQINLLTNNCPMKLACWNTEDLRTEDLSYDQVVPLPLYVCHSYRSSRPSVSIDSWRQPPRIRFAGIWMENKFICAIVKRILNIRRFSPLISIAESVAVRGLGNNCITTKLFYYLRFCLSYSFILPGLKGQNNSSIVALITCQYLDFSKKKE